MEGGSYISPEFQLGQVYDGTAVEDENVVLYRPVYVRIASDATAETTTLPAIAPFHTDTFVRPSRAAHNPGSRSSREEIVGPGRNGLVEDEPATTSDVALLSARDTTVDVHPSKLSKNLEFHSNNAPS